MNIASDVHGEGCAGDRRRRSISRALGTCIVGFSVEPDSEILMCENTKRKFIRNTVRIDAIESVSALWTSIFRTFRDRITPGNPASVVGCLKTEHILRRDVRPGA